MSCSCSTQLLPCFKATAAPPASCNAFVPYFFNTIDTVAGQGHTVPAHHPTPGSVEPGYVRTRGIPVETGTVAVTCLVWGAVYRVNVLSYIIQRQLNTWSSCLVYHGPWGDSLLGTESCTARHKTGSLHRFS